MLVFKPTYDTNAISDELKSIIENITIDKLVQVTICEIANETQKSVISDKTEGGKTNE